MNLNFVKHWLFTWDLFIRYLDGEVVSVLGPLRIGREFAPGWSFYKFLTAWQPFRLIIRDKISEVFFPFQLHPIYTPPHLPEFCFEFATVYWIEYAHQPTSGSARQDANQGRSSSLWLLFGNRKRRVTTHRDYSCPVGGGGGVGV